MRKRPESYRFRIGDLVEDVTTAVQARVEGWLNGPMLQARVVYNPAGLPDYRVGILATLNADDLVLAARGE